VIEAVLFDLDGTLLNTSALDALRQARAWKRCVAAACDTTPFDGVAAALRELRREGVRIAIVTSSVSYYAERLLGHHGIAYDAMSAWHDTSMHKPHPAPFVDALIKLSIGPAAAIGVGDLGEDAHALAAAGVAAFGAGWSATCDLAAPWRRVLTDPAEVLRVCRP
jgi:beta-phosphoglucomutase-like phosphatase (HAD superfamily)